MRPRSFALVALFALLFAIVGPLNAHSTPLGSAATGNTVVRFAQFNASVNRGSAGALLADLSAGDNAQIRNVAEIIQRINPDVLLINEFDYEPDNAAANLFQANYLAVGQNGAAPISFPYVYVAPSNTGIPSGLDLDNNGSVGGPNDAFGFGFFPGQFGMALFSKYPIDTAKVRTFQTFRWQDMPGALLPDDPATPAPADWYTPEELAAFRLSSKSHWDVPIRIDGRTIHTLVSHPTPPVFDGPEDRNGTRNHDEIRFWADYVTPGAGDYIYDDQGRTGGLRPGSSFVIMGDQNADPEDGDSADDAILQLLDSPLINTSATPTSAGGPQQAALQGGANTAHEGDPIFDTADFADTTPGNLRADYVLPSTDLRIADAKVFWPEDSDPLFRLVGTFTPSLPGGFPSSDHRAVWVDLDLVPSAGSHRETRSVYDLDPEEAPAGARTGDVDDPAIWVHPTDVSRSVVIGVLKDGGLDVFDLRGRVLQTIDSEPAKEELRYNNVDLQYGFTLGGQAVDLVAATDRRNDLMVFFTIDPATRTLTNVTDQRMPRVFTAGDDAALDEQTTAYGIALYKAPDGESYAFVSKRSSNSVAQLRIFDSGAGQVAWELVRTLSFPLVDDDPEESQVEGMVVDQELGILYAGQEQLGIWRFDAAPGGSTTGTLVDKVAIDGGNLKADVEGLTIYYTRDGGYLLASSQGDNTFAVYDRLSNAYLGSFRIGGASGRDSVQESDGADVVNVRLGPEYPFGLLVVQDGQNDPALLVEDDGELENVNTNFKFVRWEQVAGAFTNPLKVDTVGYNPRGGLFSGVLDSFSRRDGALSQPWAGPGLAGYRVSGGQLAVNTGGPLYWRGNFRANQEAFVTLSTVAGAGVQSLLLKVEARNDVADWQLGAIQVALSGAAVEVRSYEPGVGWRTVASYAAALSSGDQLGARALDDGSVQVLVNGAIIGRADTTATNGGFFVGRGGRIGLWFDGAAGAVADDFGGGKIR